MRVVLLLCALVLVACASSDRQTIRLYVPDKYTGEIRVVFGSGSGVDIHPDANEIKLVIPPSGELRVKNKWSELPDKYVFRPFTYSGAELATDEGMSYPGNGSARLATSPRRAFFATQQDNTVLLGFVGTDGDLAKDKKAVNDLYP